MKRYKRNNKNVIMSIFIITFLVFSHFSYRNVGAFNFNNSSLLYILQEDPYLPFAETMPEPEGGLEGIYKKLEYPALARKSGIEGKVYLLVYINESGNVDDIKVLKSVPGGCDDAAVKAVKAVKFSPGKNGGAPVKVKLSLCITFKMTK